jgi:acyl-CoA thioesterase I
MMTKKVDFTMLYKLLQRALFIYLAFFITSYGYAQVMPTKIACIGNSITFGARLDHPELHAYPSVLSSMLAANGYQNYSIKNYGIGGATILRFGQPNLWKVLDSLKLFIPDIVIIKAGTNETVGKPRGNWEHMAEFEKDYSDYIQGIRKINPNCKIIICSPLDMVIKTEGLSPERTADLTLRRPRIWELRNRVKKIAKQEATYFLDLTRPFKGKTNLMTKNDGVHPNQDGYQYMASLVYKFIVKRKIVMK